MVWEKRQQTYIWCFRIWDSGFGVTFPESNTNAINMPQSDGGFGRIQSDYQLLQVGLTYSYKISEQLSVGLAPTFNYSSLKLAPNPLSSPSPTLGYPVSDKATALGLADNSEYFTIPAKEKLGASIKHRRSLAV
jgi:long-chain fatty acid transport protein